ncbi:nucleoside/nucleotide kinase family protein [Demequina sp. NBRC 110053]|uniref:nucleoside/nucleotide kinase family protein n=1 Tax=Demequina sp. NBRC 110053 TaxID=1570342 RepID=UPI000A003661|nr:nucleoside/nucleotide kinase family protein [Demequina sp. NBRC 110053]
MDVEECVAVAVRMADAPGRTILGVTGAPGAGKSTLAARVAAAVNAGQRRGAVVVPMDGFHLAQAELDRLGRAQRKGAIDTFDGFGFVALLRRLRAAEEPVTYAPKFDRTLEEPVAGAIAVPRDAPLVIVEGNYLLMDARPWDQVGALLDAAWYVDLPDSVRRDRLIARHVAHGRSPESARAFALGSDQANADLIAATRERAEAVVALADTAREAAGSWETEGRAAARGPEGAR